MIEHRPSQLDRHPLSAALSREDHAFISSLSERHRLSFQQQRKLIEEAIDLSLWGNGPLSRYWDELGAPTLSGKPRTKAILDQLHAQVTRIRRAPTPYDDFDARPQLDAKPTHIVSDGQQRLLGRCPCPVSGEKTRCCNLMTLDVVQQCGFACSYCSIQSFYHQDEIRFTANLPDRLNELQLPEGTWHIGTGQSSDSLMWGNAHGVLDAIALFGRKHPEVVIELKTKSARTDWIGNPPMPHNVVATWSLNAPTFARKEEHGTASVEKRIEAAARAAEAGIPVGFHLHPMVYFCGWEEEYAAVVGHLCRLFDPSQVVMISFGTLTFTKEVLRQLRASGRPSRTLQMELVETAGKYSYPAEIKRELFAHAYGSFTQPWKTPGGPFFYLCMELPQLWEPVLSRSYADNAAFEADMRSHYHRTLGIRSYTGS